MATEPSPTQRFHRSYPSLTGEVPMVRVTLVVADWRVYNALA